MTCFSCECMDVVKDLDCSLVNEMLLQSTGVVEDLSSQCPSPREYTFAEFCE